MIFPSIDRMASRSYDCSHFVGGSFSTPSRTVELYNHRDNIIKHKDKLVIADQNTFGKELIDISWLEGAAEVYNLSKDPKDYVIADIPILTIDFPNRNSQAFPLEEVAYFDPLYGMFVYKTFVGKPTYINHDNKVPQKARGIHFDSSLQYVPEWDVWKVRVLTGWDRTKDPQTANAILNNKKSGFSMGSYVNSFLCSICGRLHSNSQPCSCIKMGRGSLVKGKICYQICIGACFFETSFVADPADISAEGNVLGLAL